MDDHDHISSLAKHIEEDMISNTLDMNVLRYSKVWEDYRILSEGLNINKEDIVLCITSSGDNVLNFLLHEPQEIYAVDLSVAQSSLLELKIAAIKGLSDYGEFLQLLGEKESANRNKLFQKIQSYLPKYASEYWEKNLGMIESGIAWNGRLEQYIYDFSAVHCKDILDPAQVDKIFDSDSIDEQRKAFNELPLEELCRIHRWFISMQKQGRSHDQMKYVEMPSDSMTEATWDRFVACCTTVPARDNYYLSWFMRGNRGFDPELKPDFAPPYLTKQGFEKLKGLVERITVCTGGVHEVLLSTKTKKFTKLSLSNIFEYMSVSVKDAMFDIAAHSLERGAVIAYFELYAPRPAPDNGKFRFLKEVCERLSPRGRNFWFNKVTIYEVQ